METEPKKAEMGNEKKFLPLEISEKTREELSALFEGREWNGEKLPPVFLKLFSSPHETEKDAQGIKELLEEADVYIPEMYEWSRQTLSKTRNVSNGSTNFSSWNEFQKTILNYLFDTKKLITFIDVPKEEVALHPEKYEGTEMYMEKLKFFSFDEAVEKYFSYAEESAKVDVVNREIYMVEHLAPQIKEVISKVLSFPKKDRINALMTLGIGHSSIYHTLKELGKEHVSRDFRYSPSAGFSSEVIRRTGFDKEVSKEMKERALCEGIFTNYLYDFVYRANQNTEKNEYFIRYIVSLFSQDEMRDVFEQWKGYEDNPTEILYFIMMKKGIIFPKTEEEMDAILAPTPYGKYQKTLEEMKKKKEFNK